MMWLGIGRQVPLLMCLGVFFFRATIATPVNTASTAPNLEELEEKLSELEDGVEKYKEQEKSSLQTDGWSTELVGDLMTPEDKQLIDRLVTRMKFLQAQQAAEKSGHKETEGNKDEPVEQQDTHELIHQDKSEGQFEDPVSQQQIREVDLSWADHVIDDKHLGVDAETPKCTGGKCLGEKAKAFLELERKLLAAMNYAKLHGISVSQLLDLLQSAKSTKKTENEEAELASLHPGY